MRALVLTLALASGCATNGAFTCIDRTDFARDQPEPTKYLKVAVGVVTVPLDLTLLLPVNIGLGIFLLSWHPPF
jgi:hypothetical protein